MIDQGNQIMSIFNEVATSIYLYVTILIEMSYDENYTLNFNNLSIFYLYLILLTEFMGDTGLRDLIG